MYIPVWRCYRRLAARVDDTVHHRLTFPKNACILGFKPSVWRIDIVYPDVAV